ncbi:MAG: isoaspartyl peptidase/L-asparaginase [Deltaproteobacteria bacterium]|nr:isoaspartyl peptidase/L-asparaginase [Deltaproteobacteria bacterium]
MVPLVVAHGGAGADGAHSAGCVVACRAAARALGAGASALEAAAAAVRVLEDDENFNAGRHSAVRLDGRTVQMDAGVADADGFGSVAGLEDVAHAVDVALAVRRSPHVMLAGAGAQAFARKLGLVSPTPLITPRRVEHARDALASLRDDPRWVHADVEAVWNFDTPPPAAVPPPTGDTVGAVVRDAQGKLAAAGSTGGTAWSLRGRVGDTPIFGAGFYASAHAALVATGIGEEIWRRMSCRAVHDGVAAGTPPMEAVVQYVRAHPAAWDVGLLCVTPAGWGAASNRNMAWAAMEGDRVVGRGG